VSQNILSHTIFLNVSPKVTPYDTNDLLQIATFVFLTNKKRTTYPKNKHWVDGLPKEMDSNDE